MMFYKKDENTFFLAKENEGITFTSEDKEGHYQAYLAWVAEGNTAEEWEPEETE
jgi:uncharacterized protein YeaC (DUF1315 family)